MSSILHEDRNGCALHGAIKVLDAIKGVVPIVHANAGCSLNARFSDNAAHASVGRNFRGVHETSSTVLTDKHVVFGGTARLREQIKNTVKVLSGDLYVVTTGCVPEVVGDDIPAMVKEARDQHFPVLGISTPGFKGNAYTGYEIAVKGILEGVAELFGVCGERKPQRVNLLGIVPEQDAYWEGDLLELESILESVGLEANRLVGLGQDVKNWKNASRARISLVVSPWGLSAARFLQERYGVPYLNLGWLPLGGKDIGYLLEKLAAELGLDEEIVETAQRHYERQTRYFLQKAASVWLQQNLQKRVVVVAPSAVAVGISRFLAGTFGQLVRTVVITDQPADDCRADLISAIHEQAANAEVAFSASRRDISERVQQARPELILGSHLELEDAERLHIPLLEISTPVRHALVLNRTYAGFRGALALVEGFAEAFLRQGPPRVRQPLAEVISPAQWESASHCGSEQPASTAA